MMIILVCFFQLLRKVNEFAEESDEDLLETESVVCQKKESCSSSEPPVKVRPKFRKYGVKDFRYLRVLGKGSFGKVILSELKDSQSSSFYAIKCLRKDLVLDDDDIECTLIERKVLALGIKHPFLCHLFCTFQTDVSYQDELIILFLIKERPYFSLTCSL